MTDEELINIYETTYKEEFQHNYEIVNTFYEPARDKKYAVELGLGLMRFIFAFRNSSELENNIIHLYDHTYKLGGSIADTIRHIPELIIQQVKNDEEWHSTNKNEVSVDYKKILGIPYGIKQVNVKPAVRMGSMFDNLSTLAEIASELGRQRAQLDLLAQLQTKYYEVGGTNTLKESDLLPVKLEMLLNLKTALSNNDLDRFFKIVQEVFATMSYDMKITEGYFHSHIHLLLKLLDFNIESEIETNIGRIDSVIETENYLHIMEFKLNDTKIALEQIKTKKYYQKYFTSNKKIILVGVALDKSERNIIDWDFQSYK